MTQHDWRDLAACINTDPAIWFPEAEKSRAAYRQAAAICAICTVRQQCLDDALATFEVVHGFRAGLRPKQRKRLLDQRTPGARRAAFVLRYDIDH